MDYNYCQNCGKINDNSGKYCPHCGREYILEKRRICFYCGKYIGISDSFCTWCGEKCSPEKNDYYTFYELTKEEIGMCSYDTRDKLLTGHQLNEPMVIKDHSGNIEMLREKLEEVEQDSSRFYGKYAPLIKELADKMTKLEKTLEEFRKAPVIPVPSPDFVIDKDGNDFVLVKYKGKGGTVEIPKGVTIIGQNSFEYCSRLKEVVVPKGVVSVGEEAFINCSELSKVTFADSVREIGESAFAYCPSLQSIVISEGTELIGKNAFFNCISLHRAEIPGSVRKIGEKAFGYRRTGKIHREDLVLRCIKGSEGETYAKNNDFEIENLST